MPVFMMLIAGLFSLMFRTDDPAPDRSPADDDRPATRADLRRYVQQLIAGDPKEAADKIANIMVDNRKYRESQHKLTDQEYAEFQAMQALGKPSEIKAKLDQGELLNQRVAAIDKAEKIKKVATAAKVANPEALAGLMSDREFEIVPIQQTDGTTIDQVLIVDGATKTPIRDFVKNHMAWAEPVLFPATTPAAQGAAANNTTGAAQGAAPGPQNPAGAAQGAAVPFAQANGVTPAQGATVINAVEIAKQFNEARSAGVKNPLAQN